MDVELQLNLQERTSVRLGRSFLSGKEESRSPSRKSRRCLAKWVSSSSSHSTTTAGVSFWEDGTMNSSSDFSSSGSMRQIRRSGRSTALSTVESRYTWRHNQCVLRGDKNVREVTRWNCQTALLKIQQQCGDGSLEILFDFLRGNAIEISIMFKFFFSRG